MRMKFRDYLTYQISAQEIIHHSYFVDFADFYYHGMIGAEDDWWAEAVSRNSKITEIIDKIEEMNAVLYCYNKTASLPHCFGLFKSHPAKRFVIISSRTDKPITEKLAKSVPENTTLFAYNVQYKHPRVIALPHGVKYGRYEVDSLELVKIPNDFDFNKRELLYCNFSITNHRGYKLRNKIYKRLKAKNWISFAHMGAFNKYSISQTEYYKHLLQHKFVLCPSGYGIDTYRVWEALYLKAIPVITLRDRQPPQHWNYFSDLPIFVLDDYTKISKSFLEDKYEEMLDQEINIEKLTMSFWKKLISKLIS